MTHNIKLRNDSTMLLLSVLAAEGWAASVKDLYHAGHLLAETFSAFEAKKDGNGNFDLDWLKAVNEWRFSEAEREAIKRAITKMAEGKRIPPGVPSFHLLTAFGLE